MELIFFTFPWVLGIKLRLLDECLYLLSHLIQTIKLFFFSLLTFSAYGIYFELFFSASLADFTICVHSGPDPAGWVFSLQNTL